MKKRIISCLLALVMLVSVFPMTAFAASSLTTSENAISFIKAVEGFNANAYWDYSQWSIGYGTTSSSGATITLEEADAALRASLVKVEEAINKFADDYSLTFTQGQFDALASLSFNCGTQWTNHAGRLHDAIVRGTTGNDFLFAISLWANAGTVPEPGLLKRRLCEAEMYLNGNYSTAQPAGFAYVIFDANGGTPGTGGEDKMQGYTLGSDVQIKVADPTKSGTTFEGWYTASTGGTKVTALNAATSGKVLYAHWSGETAQDVVATGTVKCDTYVNVRNGAGINYTITGKAVNGTNVSFFEVKTVNTTKWGRTSAGWICMDYVTLESEKSDSTEATAPSADPIATGKVSSTTALNVRSGAGTNYTRVKTLTPGTAVSIYEEKTVNGTKWGRIDDKNWVCMSYVTLDGSSSSNSGFDWEVDSSTTAPSMTAIATGKVNSTTGLNVRSGAGTNYARVKSLTYNAKISIYEQKEVGGVKWGRIDEKNWVCMSYVTLDSDKTESSTSTTETAQVTGKVSSKTNLNIRSNAGTQYSLVGTLTPGTSVTIYEQKDVNGTKWGRTDKGWVCMTYVSTGNTSNGFSWS